MMSDTRRMRPAIIGVLIVAAVLLQVAVLRYVLLRASDRESSQWLQTLKRTAQPGTDKRKITRLLGPPDKDVVAAQANEYARPLITIPKEATRVLTYSHTSNLVNAWIAYLFFDAHDHLISYEVRST